MFKISNITFDNITNNWDVQVSNERITLNILTSTDKEIDEFQKLFYPAYAITSHCSQGMSISEPYTIYEYNKMPDAGKYVVLSRARHENLISIL